MAQGAGGRRAAAPGSQRPPVETAMIDSGPGCELSLSKRNRVALALERPAVKENQLFFCTTLG